MQESKCCSSLSLFLWLALLVLQTLSSLFFHLVFNWLILFQGCKRHISYLKLWNHILFCCIYYHMLSNMPDWESSMWTQKVLKCNWWENLPFFRGFNLNIFCFFLRILASNFIMLLYENWNILCWKWIDISHSKFSSLWRKISIFNCWFCFIVCSLFSLFLIMIIISICWFWYFIVMFPWYWT